MPVQPAFLLFEILSYLLFAVCLWHAARSSRYRVAELIMCVGYGVLLEWMTLQQLEAYHYGQFVVMFDGAPLTIGVGWAVIIYSAMELSDRFDLPETNKPWLDMLQALNIDLAMDTIAIRMGMWRWGMIGFDHQWFGVPWVNFWAWFIVVMAFSTSVRTLRIWRSHRVLRWLYIPAALVLSLALLAVANRAYRTLVVPAGMELPGIILLVGCGVWLIWQARPRVIAPGSPDRVVIAVPLVFHMLYIGMGIHYGFYRETPPLAVVGVTMLWASLMLHLWSWRGWQVFHQRRV